MPRSAELAAAMRNLQEETVAQWVRTLWTRHSHRRPGAARRNATRVAFQLPGDIKVALEAAADLLRGSPPVTESPLSGSSVGTVALCASSSRRTGVPPGAFPLVRGSEWSGAGSNRWLWRLQSDPP
jgi:hypothetical protein